jgi:hypothetical protein
MSRRANPSSTTIALYGLGALAVGGVGFLAYRAMRKKPDDQADGSTSTLPAVDPAADPNDEERGFVSAIYTSSPVTKDQEPKQQITASAYLATIPVTSIRTYGPYSKGDRMPGVAALSPSPDLLLVINPAGFISDFIDKAEFDKIKKTLSA